ncbi:MAG: ABC transporter permease subunit [Deltaproteobacteria bacterium]|nr:ABC transporter permease subunit [Deltaproteobacteria bacterium]
MNVFSSIKRPLQSFNNNPLVDKGLHQSLRSKKTLLAALGGTFMGAGALFLAMVSANADRAQAWHTPSLSGVQLFLVSVGILTVIVSFAGPLFAAPEIAQEREQGTFKLLLTSHLSAGDIVVGKWGSLVVKWTLFIFIATPILSMTLLFGGLDVSVFLGGILLLHVVGACSFGVGLFASAIFERTKSAAPVAFLLAFGQFVVVLTLPFSFNNYEFGTQSSASLVACVCILAMLFVLTVSLVGARSIIASKSAQRAKYRALLRRFTLVVLPSLAVCSVWASWGADESELLIAVVGVMFISALVEGAATSWNTPRTGDAPSSPRAIATVFVESAIGLGLVAVPAYFYDEIFRSSALPEQIPVGRFLSLFFGVLVLASGIASVTSWTALLGRLFKNPALRFVAPSLVIGALLALPIFSAIGAKMLFGERDLAPGLWLNPIVQFFSAGCFNIGGASLVRDSQFLWAFPAAVGGFALTISFNFLVAHMGRRNAR